MENVNRKNELLDILAGIAILCVLTIHAHGWYMVTGIGFYNNVSGWAEWPFIDSFIDFLVTFGVAIFIFIGGFKYDLNYRIENYSQYRNYLLKRIDRIYRPYFFITFFISTKELITILYQGGQVEVIQLLKKFFMSLIIEPVFHQLWFIPMYMFIIIIYPIIRKFPLSPLQRLFCIFIIVVGANINFIKLPASILLYWFFYLIVFELGTIYSAYYEKMIDKRIQILSFATFLLIFIARRLNIDPSIDLLLVNFLRILGPVVYFYIVLKIKHESIITKAFRWLGIYSWPIFLYHDPYILGKLNNFTIKLQLSQHIWILLFTIPITIIICVIFYKIIRKTFLVKFIA